MTSLMQILLAMAMTLQIAEAAWACPIVPDQTEQRVSASGGCHEEPSDGDQDTDRFRCTIACAAICANQCGALPMSLGLFGPATAIVAAAPMPVLHGHTSALDPPVPKSQLQSRLI